MFFWWWQKTVWKAKSFHRTYIITMMFIFSFLMGYQTKIESDIDVFDVLTLFGASCNPICMHHLNSEWINGSTLSFSPFKFEFNIKFYFQFNFSTKSNNTFWSLNNLFKFRKIYILEKFHVEVIKKEIESSL